MAWKEPPSAIVLDVLMPGMNGFEVASILKSDPLTMDVPVIILSVLDEQEIGYHFGIDRYLPKQVDSRELLQNVAELSASRSGSLRLLIGGDAQHTVDPLREMLSPRFSVQGAGDFQEFRKQALTEVPNLVIVDETFAEEHKELYTLSAEASLEHVFLVILGEEKTDA